MTGVGPSAGRASAPPGGYPKGRSPSGAGNRLIRPLSDYTGELGKKWVPIAKRTPAPQLEARAKA